MTTYIFLDDIRMPPDDGNRWIVVRDVDGAWHQLLTAWYTSKGTGEIVISLDHDLGEDASGKEYPNGNDFVNKLEHAIALLSPEFRPNVELRIHSANPVGRQNMERGIQAIYKRLGR